jgi:hypothetical protein
MGAWWLDGGDSQCTAISEPVMLEALTQRKIKTAKGCSSYTALGQPLDVGKCFLTAKNTIRSETFWDDVPIAPHVETQLAALFREHKFNGPKAK